MVTPVPSKFAPPAPDFVGPADPLDSVSVTTYMRYLKEKSLPLGPGGPTWALLDAFFASIAEQRTEIVAFAESLNH